MITIIIIIDVLLIIAAIITIVHVWRSANRYHQVDGDLSASQKERLHLFRELRRTNRQMFETVGEMFGAVLDEENRQNGGQK